MKHTIIGLVLFLISTTNLSAQYEYNYIQYSINDGLPSNKIYDILQDKEGFIWLATDKGIAKFDGYSFKTFTTFDGLPNNDIWGLFEDSKGRVFARTNVEGIIYIENDSIHVINKPTDKQWLYHSAYVEFDNKVWVRNFGSVYSFDEDSLKLEFNSTIKETTPLNKLSKLNSNASIKGALKRGIFYRDSNKNGYALNYLGGELLKAVPKVYILNEREGIIDSIPLTENENLVNSYLKSPFIYKNNYLYYWSNEILYQYDFKNKSYRTQRISDFHNKESNSSNTIKYLGLRIWQIDNVLYYLDENFEISESLPLYNIKTNGRVILDNEGNWWFTTPHNGIICLTAKRKNNLQIHPSKTSFGVSSVSVDDKGRIFSTVLSGEKDGQTHQLYYTENARNHQFTFTDEKLNLCKPVFSKERILLGDAHLNTFLITSLSKKDITTNRDIPVKNIQLDLISDFEDITKLEIPVNTSFTIFPAYSNRSSVKRIMIDEASNNIWVGTHRSILKFKYNSKTQQYDSLRMVGMLRTYSLAVKEELLFAGSVDGLYYYPKSASKYTPESKQKIKNFNYKIADLKTDTLGRLWIATDGYGLYSCTDCLNASPTLIKGTEWGIVEEIFIAEDQSIWLATSKGIQHIKQNTIGNSEWLVKNYGTEFGLPTPSVNSVFVKGNIVYAATSEGITLMNPEQKIEQTVPNLLLSDIFINDKKIKKDTIIHLAYNENDILVKYVALSFNSQKSINYEYKMSGISSDWKNTKSLEREYLQVNPGKYIFHVRAVDINGIRSEIKKIVFIVYKPWWLTNLALFLFGLIIMATIYSIYKWQIKRVAQKQKEYLTVNKKFAELELQALQAQMNPHFIFNSLTAIQSFILENDIASADRYLVKFSKLMRAFLEASKEKHITLQDEIDLLKLYIQLEQLRFKGAFEVEWHIDEEVDVFVHIPSMLFQPFVENAINHGLRYKEDKGLLSIKIVTEKEKLHCTIEDNGIGRTESLAIQQQSKRSHKSRGMGIIEERLKTLELTQGLATKIEIIDLEDKFYRSIGTRVEILIHVPD